jgi:hypothetical protein
VRGVQKKISSSSTAAEATSTTELSAFGSDGFTVLTDGQVNASGDNYASWNWKANGAGVSNTDGQLTSTVSANTTSGFSIGTYTSDITSVGSKTVGHSLGVKPNLIITKNLGVAGQRWGVQAPGLFSGDSYILDLSGTGNEDNQSGNGSLATVNSTVFSVNWAEGLGNANLGGNYVFYAFANKKGFSKVGTYRGNSSADGTFVYTGFKPAWVMIKQYSSDTGNANEVWGIRDNKRDTFNPIAKSLFANNSSADATTSTHYVDFVSNGFKIRTGTENSLNTNYGYIFMAFAEAPLVGSNNVPATAR